MGEWLKSYGAWGIVALFAVWKGWQPCFNILRHLFHVTRAIHDQDARLIEGYEREKVLISGEREREKTAKENAIRGAARQQVRILELVEQLELKEEVNKRDRIARIIYLKHLRECGRNVEAIEEEIKSEFERKIISDGLASTD